MIFEREDAILYTKDGVLEIPDHYQSLRGDFAYFVVRSDLPSVHTLKIPKSVKEIGSMRGDYSCGPYGYRNNPFEEIIVAKDNESFKSKDGVLYSKDMRTLISYPCGKRDTEFKIPEGVEEIAVEAFLNVEHLRTIRFPKSMIYIYQKAFSACKGLDFPDIIDVFLLNEAEEEYLICIPEITEEYYEEGAKTLSYRMKKGQFEYVGEAVKTGKRLETETERAELIKKFEEALEREYWLSFGKPELKKLFAFKSIFYSEHC